jgi:hypothetical protein
MQSRREKFFTVIFSFLIPSYPVICHCVRIHISTVDEEFVGGDWDIICIPEKLTLGIPIDKNSLSTINKNAN